MSFAGNSTMPAWYTPEGPPQIRPVSPTKPATRAPSPASNKYPDWYTPDPAATPAAPAPAANAKLPDWYQPEEQPAAQADAGSSDLADIGKNVLTGLARVPGAVAGLPAAIVHAKHWLDAQTQNAATGGNVTATDLDKENPLTSALPTAEGVDKAVFAATGTQPYEPTTTGGTLGQAAVTGVGAGLVDPLADWSAIKNFGQAALPAIKAFLKANAAHAAKTGLATTAAEGAHEIAPNSDILPVAAAVLAHGGASLAADAGRAGYDVVRPIVAPKAAARAAAGGVLASVDNSLPGIANPDSATMQDAANAIRAATDTLGTGEQVTNAMQSMRDYLGGLKGNLEDVRDAEVAPAYAKFRAEQPVIPPNATPIMRIPAIRPAMNRAATDMLNGAGAGTNPYGAPTTDWTDFNAAGDPIYRSGALTPDLLDRTKIKLNNQANQASDSLDTHRASGLKAAAGRLTGFLDEQYPNTYPQAREAYTRASEPLQPFETNEVSQALQTQTDRLGRPLGYAMNNGELFDRLAKTKDPASVVRRFIEAAGNESPVVTPIEQAVIGRLHDTGAIDPQTGEVNPRVFESTVKPYLPTLSLYSKGLIEKFGTAKAAQGTLDGLREQEAVAQGVKDGALRDDSGLVTQSSFSKWLERNKKTLAGTQDPNTLMRLKQIAAALPNAPGAGAEAVVEGLPAAVGFTLGGSESGIFGAMFHKIPDWLAGPRIAAFKDAYSKLIETAALDPAETKRLVAQINSRPKGQTPTQALGQIVLKRTKQAIAGAPLATNAAQLPTP